MLQKAHRNFFFQKKSYTIVWKNGISELFHWTTEALLFTFLSRYSCTIYHTVLLLRRVVPPFVINFWKFIFFRKWRDIFFDFYSAFRLRDYHPLWFHFPKKTYKFRNYIQNFSFACLRRLNSFAEKKCTLTFFWFFQKKQISFAITFCFPVGFFLDKGGFPFQVFLIYLFPLGNLLF